MFEKKFKIIRYIIILFSIISLGVIYYLEKNTINIKKNELTIDVIINASKKYVNDNKDYFNDIIKENIEYRITTKELVDKNYLETDKDFIGYIKLKDNSYEFVSLDNFLIDVIMKDETLYKEINNENMPYDINYIYKGEPNNYLKYEDKLYRIIGITNSNNLKLISVDGEEIEEWGNDGNINFFSSNIDEIGNKGIFYVGFVRSETNDISQIIKNEKRNNNYTVIIPKYYGTYSYVNISDIINASDKCNFNKITDINKDNCDSYLLDLLNDSYTVTTLEDDRVYYIDDLNNVVSKILESNINIHRVIYINGVTGYSSGDGSIDNPFVVENY